MANKIRNIAAPNLPVAPAQYERRYFDQFSNILRLFFSLVTNAVNAPKPHASFYDTTTQANPVASAVNYMRVNSTYSDTIESIKKDTDKIFISETGVYNIQFSAQLDKTGGGASNVFIWLAINGQPLAHSATKIVIDGPNNEVVPAWNWVVPLLGGDYFQIAWQSPDTNVVLAAAAATGNIPEIPSVILTVTWVSNENVRNGTI
jgi:hypothetical protein